MSQENVDLPSRPYISLALPWRTERARPVVLTLPEAGIYALLEQCRVTEEAAMGDRMQRVEGKLKEAKGRAKQGAGRADGRPGTEARGGGELLAGKAKNAVGKARSAVKRNTR
jgi:uncharacterized protein YjbJ (UPF0337 family)